VRSVVFLSILLETRGRVDQAHLVSVIQPNKPNRPNKQDKPSVLALRALAPLTPRQPALSAISYTEIGARLEQTANNNEKEV